MRSRWVACVLLLVAMAGAEPGALARRGAWDELLAEAPQLLRGNPADRRVMVAPVYVGLAIRHTGQADRRREICRELLGEGPLTWPETRPALDLACDVVAPDWSAVFYPTEEFRLSNWARAWAQAAPEVAEAGHPDAALLLLVHQLSWGAAVPDECIRSLLASYPRASEALRLEVVRRVNGYVPDATRRVAVGPGAQLRNRLLRLRQGDIPFTQREQLPLLVAATMAAPGPVERLAGELATFRAPSEWKVDAFRTVAATVPDGIVVADAARWVAEQGDVEIALAMLREAEVWLAATEAQMMRWTAWSSDWTAPYRESERKRCLEAGKSGTYTGLLAAADAELMAGTATKQAYDPPLRSAASAAERLAACRGLAQLDPVAARQALAPLITPELQRELQAEASELAVALGVVTDHPGDAARAVAALLRRWRAGAAEARALAGQIAVLQVLAGDETGVQAALSEAFRRDMLPGVIVNGLGPAVSGGCIDGRARLGPRLLAAALPALQRSWAERGSWSVLIEGLAAAIPNMKAPGSLALVWEQVLQLPAPARQPEEQAALLTLTRQGLALVSLQADSAAVDRWLKVAVEAVSRSDWKHRLGPVVALVAGLAQVVAEKGLPPGEAAGQLRRLAERLRLVEANAEARDVLRKATESWCPGLQW